MINIDFSADMRRIGLWAHRMGVDLRDSRHLLEPYMLAQQYLLQSAELLVEFHGFHRIEPTHHRVLFSVTTDASDAERTPSLMPPRQIIELPIEASSFFSPDRQLQWEHVFHSKLWFHHGRRIACMNTTMDLLYLLQCLLPGMLLVVEVWDGWSTQKGIPPLHWLLEHKEVLVVSVGPARFALLCQAAADVKRAVIDSRDVSTGMAHSLYT